MMRSDREGSQVVNRKATESTSADRPVRDRPHALDSPLQDGTLRPLVREPASPPVESPRQRSGLLHRPIDEIQRSAVTADNAVTELEQYKLSMRKYAPVQKGRAGLPWTGQWHCDGCGETSAGQLVYDEYLDAIFLEIDCPKCGPRRERHHDVLFVKKPRGLDHPRQPKRTHAGSPIRPIITELPKTVETLCPECSCLILGRCFVHRGIVWMEKTCPEHGYFRDKVNTDVELYLKGTRAGYQDERGVHKPQVAGAAACPTDCGLCNQHHSASCLAQIDLTNRCNLNCPVCFASANAARGVAEPSYEMVVEYLRALRKQHPYPATAIQFTGGEPTLHPDFHRIIKTTCEMGFSHVQIATNGLKIAEREFTERAAEAGLHTLYMQFDGLDDEQYQKLRGRPLLDVKMRAIENCRRTGMKVCLVPTIVKTINEDQVGSIFRFAVENADVISAISYQPVAFTGRISLQQLADQRYTLGDLAHDLAACSEADVQRDFFPLNFMTPLARIMQTLDGKPKIRPSCHSDCAFGTYFFVTPDRQAIPVPKLFAMAKLMHGFNEHAARIERRRPHALATWTDKLRIVLTFLRSYRWSERDFRVTPLKFIHALRGMTNKSVGRGAAGETTYRTLMAAGMHFMDRYNFDTERIKRCVILYSTPDGIYPFCTINGGPTYRPYIERMLARTVNDTKPCRSGHRPDVSRIAAVSGR
ncbi:MAG: radical SAM protein [Phycisphaerae bacterium]|nr:radical SAM protein [Phycisphaerae bacterium]